MTLSHILVTRSFVDYMVDWFDWVGEFSTMTVERNHIKTPETFRPSGNTRLVALKMS